MGKWTGKGQPPTRKKLHRVRVAAQKERAAELREQNALRRLGTPEWAAIERKAQASGVALERFWQVWVDDTES